MYLSEKAKELFPDAKDTNSTLTMADCIRSVKGNLSAKQYAFIFSTMRTYYISNEVFFDRVKSKVALDAFIAEVKEEFNS